jgi:hypothetical protein
MKLSLAISVLSSRVAMSLTIRPAEAQSSITEQEVYAIGVDAYPYFCPLVTAVTKVLELPATAPQ